MYARILSDGCIPLTEIPPHQQEAYAKEYLLRDRYVDIDLMRCASGDPPCLSEGVQSFFRRTNLVRESLRIRKAYAADRTVTSRLTALAAANNTTYRTLMRERRADNESPMERYLRLPKAKTIGIT